MKQRPAAFAATCLCLSIALACLAPASARASVRDDDSILGKSVAERALPAEECPSIDASFAALMDEDGTLWFGRGAAERTQIASLTKIMTALVAVECLEASATIEVTPEAASVGESSAGLVQGDAMTFDDALKALLAASGNDAASAIAQAAGAVLLSQQGLDGDAVAREAAFVEAMNAKAVELGLANSHFANPHGLDFDAYAQGQYGCAADVAATLRAAMQHDLVRENIGFSQVDIEVQRAGSPVTLTLTNTDTMLIGYEGTCAAKTGFTLSAGPCVAAAVNRDDGHEYYVVVLGSSSKPQRFADAEALCDWVFAQRGALEAQTAPEPARPEGPSAAETLTYQLINAPRSTKAEIDGVERSYPVVAEVAHGDWPNRTVEATVADADASVAVAVGSGKIEQDATFAALSGDVERGDAVGRLTFRQDGEVLWEGDLVALADVAAPSWWEAIGIGVERFFGGMLGVPATAESALLARGPLKVS